MRSLFTITLSLCLLSSSAQDELDDYLRTHHYAFSLDSGFDQHTSTVLKQKLADYRMVMLGEGGSHFLTFYEPLSFVWVRFLQQQFGMKHMFLEAGYSTALLLNQYARAGDGNMVPVQRSVRAKNFWNMFTAYNRLLPEDDRLMCLGIDFESPKTYFRALQVLIAPVQPPVNIQSAVNLIATAKDSIGNCNQMLAVNKVLRESLHKYRPDWQTYLAGNVEDFEWIITNKGNCADVYKNRNRNMAERFLRLDEKVHGKFYFGQLGMAHTVLRGGSAASIINNSPEFKSKVAVVNTYCYNCTTSVEAVSNWQLHKIEKDILAKLLPYCGTDFTLFDFTEKNPTTARFRAFGSFLIIAKNQH